MSETYTVEILGKERFQGVCSGYGWRDAIRMYIALNHPRNGSHVRIVSDMTGEVIQPLAVPGRALSRENGTN